MSKSRSQRAVSSKVQMWMFDWFAYQCVINCFFVLFCFFGMRPRVWWKPWLVRWLWLLKEGTWSLTVEGWFRFSAGVLQLVMLSIFASPILTREASRCGVCFLLYMAAWLVFGFGVVCIFFYTFSQSLRPAVISVCMFQQSWIKVGTFTHRPSSRSCRAVYLWPREVDYGKSLSRVENVKKKKSDGEPTRFRSREN